MTPELQTAFGTGYERMAAWSDLLDDINLYPVADADTGCNLRISLAPLKNAGHPRTAEHLRSAATGNSGNIAAAFFAAFVSRVQPVDLHTAAQSGQQAAWHALLDPQRGTMLNVFDAWAACTAAIGVPFNRRDARQIKTQLKASVLATAEILPTLKGAGVVDAGALGMFLFLEGFSQQLVHENPVFESPSELFGDKLAINSHTRTACTDKGYCVDTIIETDKDATQSLQQVATLGDSVVALPDGHRLKIHFHTQDGVNAREKLAGLGDVVQWRQEKISEVAVPATISGKPREGIHIVTDAAGSLTRETARQLGITLLDSYVIMGDRHLPETWVDREALYAAMRQGTKVTTAQASIFERHQTYQSLLHRYAQIVYLSVGSAYTGNYDVARQWQTHHPTDRLHVIDSTAASGRLAMIVMATARFAQTTPHMDAVSAYAQTTMTRCQELIFIDQLKYLVAGGRVSKAQGFFGDLLHFKPVITPRAEGVEKIGVVKNQREQCRFALDHLGQSLTANQSVEILVEYTDNLEWVSATVCPQIRARFPKARVRVVPMSLTSGVHMGPGTWAVAFLPQE